MVICVDRVRKKTDKFLDLIYKSNPKNFYYKSDTIDVFNKSPRVFRGITRMPTIKQCVDNNIDFYYIDTGYMGCYPVKKWQRFTKNNLQTLDHLNYKQLDFLTDVKVLKKRFKDITNIDYDNYKPKRPVEGESILKQQGTSRVNATINSSVSSMGVLAKQVYAASLTDKTQGLGAKWKMPEGQTNFDLKKMLAAAKTGNTTELMEFSNYVDGLDYGDIIQVDGHLATFTGLTHIYDNITVSMPGTRGTLKMPILFVGNISPDSRYMYTDMDF